MKNLLIFLFCITYLLSNEKKININFKDLHLQELVEFVSLNTEKNILLTTKLEGKVDFISNKPVDKKTLLNILKVSLNDNDYELRKTDNIYRIVKKIKNKPFKNRPKTLISRNITDVLYLKHIDVEELKKILNTIIEKRAYKKDNIPSVTFDKKANLIILDGKENIVNSLKAFIKKIDISKEQVYIKARIIELDDNLVEEIGLQYGILGANTYSGGINSFSSSLNSGEAIPFDIGNIGLSIPNLSSSLALGATLNLLNKTYALDIVSQPSILCLNNNESVIYVGETVSIQTASTTTDGGTIKDSFERQDIGLTLKVKPRVLKNNKVLIDIDTTLEGIKNIDLYSSNPNTSKKYIKTSAIVNNGESVILGGLIEKRNEKSIEKVPLASDIPLIGELFQNRLNDNTNKNLTIIITPYIIPKNKDLTFIRKELSKLQSLEDIYLKKSLIKLKNKMKEKKESVNKKLTHKELLRSL